MAPRRGRRQAGVVAVVTRPDPLEATVAGHTARHLTATTYCQPGRSNTEAAQLIESVQHPSPAPMRARGTAAAAALAAVLVCTTHTAPAEAALSSVSPGDRIATPDLCTIGYTYIGTDVS